ncbi:MAG: hypothetical protein ACJ0J5_06140 [Dehalococcoidia bacterium]|nr:MAG: hypothetical protein CBD90_03535 [Chloroflexi bacterium TMED230]
MFNNKLLSLSYMNKEIEETIKNIHSIIGIKGSLVITGCGISSLAWLFGVSGTSNTILTSYVPYSKNSLQEFLDKKLTNHVSEEEAINMAQKAYEKSESFVDQPSDNTKLFGLGCTGAISTNRARKGEDRAHIAIKTNSSLEYFSLYFDKNNRDRISEDIIISKQIINCIANVHGINNDIPLNLLENEKFYRSH